ncbi:MAG: DUF3667 domain-containing protein [Oceanihabitans sp.]
MKCSVCSNEIRKNYCSNCGQYFKDRRVTSITIFWGLFDSFFSIEKSFLMHLKMMLTQPQTIVSNYWKGFRKYYFSPFQFFTFASLFLLINYLFSNQFLGLAITSNISSHFAILILNINLLTIFSAFLYIKFKKNIFEHFILNIYNVSLWTIMFAPISIILSLVAHNNGIAEYFLIPFHLLIMIWNSKAFELNKLNRFLFVSINLALFYGAIFFLKYFVDL